MRKIMLTLMGLLALTFMSCSDDDKNDGIKNYWTISCENKKRSTTMTPKE